MAKLPFEGATVTVKIEGEPTPKVRELIRQVVHEEMLKLIAEIRRDEAPRVMAPPEVK